MKRIGLFGGTFDPIHMGHLQAAKLVKNGYGLDSILFIPSAIPPHKQRSRVTDAIDRLEMLRLALVDSTDFLISDTELKRKGPSYTIDTVRRFISIYPKKTIFYLIIGHDAFLEIDTWKAYISLFSEIPFIILIRPEMGQTDVGPKVIDTYLKSKVSDAYQYDAEESCYFHSIKQSLHIFSSDLLQISSTDIRERVRKKGAIDDVVPESVIQFISDRGLYQ